VVLWLPLWKWNLICTFRQHYTTKENIVQQSKWLTDLENDFLVCIDAYREGLGGVLMQEGKVINYES
jgi:hypothetical protein